MFQSDKISRSRARIFSTSASTVAAWTSDGSDISEGIRRHQYLSVLWLVSVVCIWTAWPLPSPYHPLPTLQWPQCYKLQLWPQHITYSILFPSLCQILPSTQTSCALWKQNDVNLLQPNRMQDSFKSSSQRPWHLYDFHFRFDVIAHLATVHIPQTSMKPVRRKKTLSRFSLDLLFVRVMNIMNYNQPT